MALQIQGNGGTVLEVESASRAARTTIKPLDYSSGGSYSHGAVSGTISAGLSANSLVYSFRFVSSTLIALVRRVTISAGNTSTTFTAGVVIFNMFVARSYTASETTGGNDVTMTAANDNKRKTGMAASQIEGTTKQIYIANTGALSGGSKTLDNQPCGSVVSSIPAVAGTPLFPPTNIWDPSPDAKYPLYLGTNEGFILQATVPATGTWQFGVTVDWDEVPATSWF